MLELDVRRFKHPITKSHPRLAIEWDVKKNVPLKASEVTPGSGRKVWWICRSKFKHSWPATVASRAKGGGCPYCSNKRASPENCLARVNPRLAEEWHPSRNGSLSPFDVLPNTRKKIWWCCRHDETHVWKAWIYSRNTGRGCPQCVSSTSEPELRLYSEIKHIFKDAIQRHKIDRIECDIFIPSLSVGIEVDGSYWHESKRQKDLSKTKFFKSKKVKLIRLRGRRLGKLGDNDVIYTEGKRLAFDSVVRVFQKIILLANLPSKEVNRVQSYIKGGKFRNSRLYENTIHNRASPIRGNELVTRYPEVAKEWHPTKNGRMTPEKVSSGSSRSAWWQCDRGHAPWKTTIAHRTRSGTNCPECTGQRIGTSNSMATLRPDLAKLWHPTKNGSLTPADVPIRVNRKVWWICAEFGAKHSYPRLIANMALKPSCSICANKYVDRVNSLAEVNPELAKEWHPTKNGSLTPLEIHPGSHKYVWWRCKKNKLHVWDAPPINRKQSPKCPFCTHRRIHKTESLAAIRPEIAREWHPTKNGELRPDMVGPYSGKRVWWFCRKNSEHVWQSYIQHRRPGCPFCKKKTEK